MHFNREFMINLKETSDSRNLRKPSSKNIKKGKAI